MATEPLTKRPGENRLYSVDFGNQPELRDGDQALTGTPSVSVSPSGVTAGTAAISGNAVQFRLSGGADGQDYTVTVSCGTDDGTTVLQEALTLKVRLLP